MAENTLNDGYSFLYRGEPNNEDLLRSFLFGYVV